MEKKTYVIMLSGFFPAKHTKAGLLTNFRLNYTLGKKIHTIRANYELWEKRAKQINTGNAVLSIRAWGGKPYRSKQYVIDELEKIGIEKISMDYLNPYIMWQINNRKTNCHLWEVAKNDGLSYDNFIAWFFPKNITAFNGAIIHFTDFRYSKNPIN